MRFDLLLGVAVADGLGEAFFRFGEVSGDGVGVAFFFRCLRLGVGDGSKTFLIFVPNDSWAEGAASTAPKKITRIRSHFITRRRSIRCPQRRFGRRRPAGCAEDSARYSIPSVRQFLKDGFIETDAAFEILERKILVRRMGSTIWQRESHQ